MIPTAALEIYVALSSSRALYFFFLNQIQVKALAAQVKPSIHQLRNLNLAKPGRLLYE